MVAVDIATVRQQEFGYAEHNGVTGGVGHPSVVVTSLADSGTGTLRAAIAGSASNRYVTFDPSIHGGTISLASLLTSSGNNITIDGVGANITVTGHTSRFEGDNIVIAGMNFKDAGAIDRDCITLRRPTSPATPQRVLISWCTLHNPTDPANTDTTLDIIWRRGEDTIVTVVGTFHGRSKRGSLVHAGDSTAPGGNEERGWYYITWAYCHWFKCFERHPFTREGHIHIYNNYLQRYGGAASSGSGARMGDDDASIPMTNWMLAENCVVLPLGIGEEDYLGVVATNPQEKWFGPSSSNNGTPNMRADGTYLKTNPAGNIVPTEEEIDAGSVGTPPYSYDLAPANDALADFVYATAGHPAAKRSTLPGQEVNPAIGIAILWANRQIIVHTDETGGTVSAVDLVVGANSYPMTEISSNVWSATAGPLTAGTATTIKAVATSTAGTVESPLYPAFVLTSGAAVMVGTSAQVVIEAASQGFGTIATGSLVGSTAQLRIDAASRAIVAFKTPPRQGTWRFGVGPRTADRPAAEVSRWTACRITETVDRGITAAMTLPANDPASALIDELASDLWAYLDGDLYARFRITKVDQAWGESGEDDIDLTLMDDYAILFRRKTATELTFTNVGQGQIVWSLIAHAQAQTGGSLGLVPGTLDNSVLRDRVYEPGSVIGELIDQLTKVENGPRVVFTPTKVVDVLAAGTWPVNEQPLVRGSNARSLHRQSGADRFGNAAFGTGDTEQTDMVIAEAADLDVDPRGRWDIGVSWPSVILQDTLVEHTVGALREAITPVSVWRSTIEPLRWFAESNYRPGDLLSIVQPRTTVAPLQAATLIAAQMTELELAIDGDGGTAVTGAFVAVG